jgi:hypothetical protein
LRVALKVSSVDMPAGTWLRCRPSTRISPQQHELQLASETRDIVQTATMQRLSRARPSDTKLAEHGGDAPT